MPTFLSLISPTNLEAEKEKFFASKTYHPTFRYSWQENNFLDLTGMRSVYRELLLTIENQDTQEIVTKAKKLFQSDLDKQKLASAHSIISNKPEKMNTPTIDQICTRFNAAFSFLGLHNYTIEVSDQAGFNFRPQCKDKKLVVSKHVNMEFFSLDGEIKHELTHIIRYENSQFNLIGFSDDYLPTEEGLACYFQDYCSQDGSSSLFQHAAEYVSTEVCLSGSLRDCIDFLRDIGFSPELAWQRAVRHKFGWIDTSKPGDLMKPSMYFHHEQEMVALPNKDRLRLLVGKISLEELEYYPSYSGRIPLTVMQDFYERHYE